MKLSFVKKHVIINNQEPVIYHCQEFTLRSLRGGFRFSTTGMRFSISCILKTTTNINNTSDKPKKQRVNSYSKTWQNKLYICKSSLKKKKGNIFQIVHTKRATQDYNKNKSNYLLLL